VAEQQRAGSVSAVIRGGSMRRLVVRVNRDKYRLSLSGFSGDATDNLANPSLAARNCNGMQFSTPDQDNDLTSDDHCADDTGGWWFNNCADVRLTSNGNGRWSSDWGQKDVLRTRMLVKLN